MGAAEFWQTGEGKTIQDAFNRAHEQAAWEYGHGGYTGSLAEKGEFIDFTPKAKALGASLKMRKSFVDWAMSSFYADEYTKREKGYVRIPVIARNYTFGLSGSGEMLVPVKVPQKYRALVATMAASIQDKWGPAGAIEIGREKGMKRGYRRYIFFGWASS